MTLKTIDSFITTVDPKKTTVVSFPEFIAIFGSEISIAEQKSPPLSKRDAFYWWFKDNRSDLNELILLPESYNDWGEFTVYSDLLLFEKDLGYLTSAVIIFLESPGSIAELGAFSQIDSLSERLIVVVSDNHHPQRSFISLGPIRNIAETKKHPHSLCVIPNVTADQLIDHMDVINMCLTKKIAPKSQTTQFDQNNLQHQILLCLDLINLFLVIQKTELMTLIKHFDVEINAPRLNQILFLLDKTKLIFCKHYGDNQYYAPLKFKKTYIDYTSKLSQPSFKRDRTKALVWEEIQKDAYLKYVYYSVKKLGDTK
jgi:hypothetical protein